MHDDDLIDVLRGAADAVRHALDDLDDWGLAGTRAGQYRSDLAADDACLAVLDDAGLGWLSEESGVEHADRERLVVALAPYGESLDGGTGDVIIRLREGLAGLPGVVRAVDDAGLTLAHLEIQAPSLDDVFLAKTGRSLEGAGEDEPAPDRTGLRAPTISRSGRGARNPCNGSWMGAGSPGAARRCRGRRCIRCRSSTRWG